PVPLRELRPKPVVKLARNTRASTSLPSHALQVPKSHTDSHMRSYTRIWNQLPEDLVGNPSLDKIHLFKKGVNAFLLAA
ncbi:hypothetical protein, partial [Acinetobacter baumannii]|uniref:hypothetical protein n=1 Tax=Acinetobacter baumannii TaxID=470 RepID=UPI001C0748E4